MKFLLTREQMSRLERDFIQSFKLSESVLMETAGRAVCLVAQSLSPKSVLVLAGKGNNGGDALVVARSLVAQGFSVSLLDIARTFESLYEVLAKTKIRLVDARDVLQLSPFPFDLVIDGLFGTGLQRVIEDQPSIPYRTIIERINSISGKETRVVSIDLPSGVDANTGKILGIAIKATHTVSLQSYKRGHFLYPGRGYCGELSCQNLGILELKSLTSTSSKDSVSRTDSIVLLEREDLSNLLYKREANTHKGNEGHVFVIGGEPERPGALMLAAKAALKSGAGLVTVSSARETIARVAGSLWELMAQSWNQDSFCFSDVQSSRADTFVIGPGLTPTTKLKDACLEAVCKDERPKVLDAGALVSLGVDCEQLSSAPTRAVLTPHPKEAGILLGVLTEEIEQDRVAAVQKLAKKTGQIVILKGASSLIASPHGQVSLCREGHAGMASAGMGDVLSGIVGAFCAKAIHKDPKEQCTKLFQAAEVAVLLHAVCAESIGRRPLTARELIDQIPQNLS